MLDHLDDPTPFEPSERLRTAVMERGRRLRRRRRLVGGGVAVVVLLAGVTTAGALYVDRRDAAIDRTELSTAPSTDGATNVLLLGVDAPAGEPGHADTMVVVRFEVEGGIRLLSVPRDLWDETAGQRVNATGGGAAAAEAVTRATGIPIDHLVELRFDGFEQLIDDLGGLPVQVVAPLRDASTGLQLESSACANLDGPTALALVRSRRLEHEEAGTWRADPRSDLGRMARVQVLMQATVAGLAEVGNDVWTIDELTRTLADHAALDSGLSVQRLADLAQRVAAAGPEGITSDVLPVESARRPDGAAVLYLATSAEQILAGYGAPGDPSTRTSNPVPPPSAPVLIAPC